jgi:cell division protein YceG involved in septum cleavage
VKGKNTVLSHKRRRRKSKTGVVVMFVVISLVLVLAAAVAVLIREYANQEDELSTRVDRTTTISIDKNPSSGTIEARLQ